MMVLNSRGRRNFKRQAKKRYLGECWEEGGKKKVENDDIYEKFYSKLLGSVLLLRFLIKNRAIWDVLNVWRSLLNAAAFSSGKLVLGSYNNRIVNSWHKDRRTREIQHQRWLQVTLWYVGFGFSFFFFLILVFFNKYWGRI